MTSCTEPAAAPLGTLIPYFPINSAPCRTTQSTIPNPSAPTSRKARINPAKPDEKWEGKLRDLGARGHLVLVDVEAAELLVLPSPGDGEGAGRKLPERSANHGCGDLGEAGSSDPGTLQAWKGDASSAASSFFPFLFTRSSLSLSYLRKGCGGGLWPVDRGQ